MILLIAVPVVFLLFFLVCVIPVLLEFKIIIHDGRSRVFFVISALGGLIHFRYKQNFKPGRTGLFSNVGRKDSPPGKKRIFDDGLFGFIKRSYESFRRNSHYLEYLKDRIRIKEFSLSAQIGTGDAANTAILAAGLYTLSCLIFCHIKNTYQAGKRNINVYPLFDKEMFKMEAACIIILRMGHIIIVGMQKITDKIKGGERIARASN